MSETLWAAVIGGVIGGIIAIAATIPPLIYSHYHWKKEKKLEHLITERRHFEEQYVHIIAKLPDLIEKGGDPETIARMSIIFPDDIGVEFGKLILQATTKKIDKVLIIPKISLSMREALAKTDKEINKLLS